MSDLCPCAFRTDRPTEIRQALYPAGTVRLYGCRYWEQTCCERPVLGAGVVRVCSETCEGYIKAQATKREVPSAE